VSLALGRTRVESEGGRVVWEADGEAGVDAVRDPGKGGGEEDIGVGASGVDCSGRVEAPVDGEIDENNWWDWDTEGRGKGGPEEEEESPIDAASVSRRTKVLDMLMVGA